MLPWSIGQMILAGIAYLLPYWSHLQLVISVPSLFITMILLIPNLIVESPKWLLLHDRREEAEEIMSFAAKMNGREDQVKSMKPNQPAAHLSSSSWCLRDLLSGPHLMIC